MKISKKLAGLALSGVVLTGLLTVPAVAQAAVIPTGTLTVTPTTGSATADPFLTVMTSNEPCPVGFRLASVTSVYQGGVRLGNVSNVRNQSTPNTYGQYGFTSAPISIDRVASPTNDYLTNKPLSGVPGLVDGAFSLRVFCFDSETTFNYATAPFFELNMQLAAGTWSLYSAPAGTTTSLSATATGSTVALAATVKKLDGSTATDAVGNVVFKEGTTTVGTIAVANGVAATSLTSVTDGVHTYTAEFVPTSGYSGSTSSSSTVQVGGQSAQAVITVALPDNIGALTLTGVPTAVNMNTATLNGETLDATGTVTAVVTDTRQLDKPAWSLTGQVTNFQTTGGAVLDGKYLGWTPTITSGPSNSIAGAAVSPAPTSTDGIKSIAPFANGAPSAQSDVTNASAALLLKAPRDTVAGTYTATLTVTLI